MCFTRASGEQTCTLAASTTLEPSPAAEAIHCPLQHPSKVHPCTPPSHPLPTQPFACHLLSLGRDHIPAQEEPAGMCTAGLGCHPAVREKTFSIRNISDRRSGLAGEADRTGWWSLCESCLHHSHACLESRRVPGIRALLMLVISSFPMVLVLPCSTHHGQHRGYREMEVTPQYCHVP